MQALYFGDSAQPVYGVVHEPASATRSSAIVIHQPLGHEYFRTHRALTLLADQLAMRGYYVLRYDYAGCGDSHGDLEQFSLSDWVGNARQACEEITAISGAVNVINIGVRFGAAIAGLAASPLATRHIFWDAQLSGRSWLRYVQALQQRVLNDSWWFRFRRHHDIAQTELLSARYSADTLSAIEAVAIAPATLANAHYLFSSIGTQIAEVNGQAVICSEQFDWQDERAIDRVITINQINKHILDLLS